MVWACATKRRQWLDEEMEYEVEDASPRSRQKKTWTERGKRLSVT